MATTRIDMRLDKEIKLKAEKATALLGHKSLTEYLVRLIDKDASKVIEEHKTINLEDDVFDRFSAACTQVKKPNQALLDAVKFTKKQGIK